MHYEDSLQQKDKEIMKKILNDWIKYQLKVEKAIEEFIYDQNEFIIWIAIAIQV